MWCLDMKPKWVNLRLKSRFRFFSVLLESPEGALSLCEPAAVSGEVARRWVGDCHRQSPISAISVAIRIYFVFEEKSSGWNEGHQLDFNSCHLHRDHQYFLIVAAGGWRLMRGERYERQCGAWHHCLQVPSSSWSLGYIYLAKYWCPGYKGGWLWLPSFSAWLPPSDMMQSSNKQVNFILTWS